MLSLLRVLCREAEERAAAEAVAAPVPAREAEEKAASVAEGEIDVTGFEQVVRETEAKVEKLRSQKAEMHGKKFADERSEINREIRELEESDAYVDALKALGRPHPATEAPRGGRNGAASGIRAWTLDMRGMGCQFRYECAACQHRWESFGMQVPERMMCPGCGKDAPIKDEGWG